MVICVWRARLYCRVSALIMSPAASVAASERVDVSCNIRTPRTANGVSIQGVASADRDLDGDYELHITKSGANSSDVSQAGAFTLRARASAVLGESEISLSRGEHLRAAGADHHPVALLDRQPQQGIPNRAADQIHLHE